MLKIEFGHFSERCRTYGILAVEGPPGIPPKSPASRLRVSSNPHQTLSRIPAGARQERGSGVRDRLRCCVAGSGTNQPQDYISHGVFGG